MAKPEEEIQTKKIPIADIVIVPEIRQRVRISESLVEEYQAILRDGRDLDPIEVFADTDDQLKLADGEHRKLAHEREGREVIPANIHILRDPSESDLKAFLLGVSKNAKHGSKLNNADKRKIVKHALSITELRRKGDATLAQLLNVSAGLVKSIRSGEDEVKVSGHKRRKPGQAKEEKPTEIETLRQWLDQEFITPDDILNLLNSMERFKEFEFTMGSRIRSVAI